MSGKLAITLRKSLITFPEDQRRTVRALGLRKLNQTVVLPDNPATRGAAFKVRHLVEVQAVREDEAEGTVVALVVETREAPDA